jgi:hypothetical protein
MISCEEFERYLLDLHQGKVTAELKAALVEHRRVCKTCNELTPELIQVRERLLGLVKLEPRPGFEMRLAQRMRGELEPAQRRYKIHEESWAMNWLAFATGAIATVAIGFLLVSHKPELNIVNAPTSMTAENVQSADDVPAVNPELLTRGGENLPFGSLDDSTGEFHLISNQDSLPVDIFMRHPWPEQVVSQPK